jgi:hypothetical protein
VFEELLNPIADEFSGKRAWLSALTGGKAKTRIAHELLNAVREQEALLRKRKTGPALSRAARKLALCGHLTS